MTLTYDILFRDLHRAYYAARRKKRGKDYQREFESRLETNLRELCDDLYRRRYRARPSTCFIITDPKRREVFAADFRDRIVHHLYFNYVHEMLERTFIADSYSCIRKRGTSYGIRRLERHIRQASLNYTEDCYVLKMDVKGYFMHIDRRRLLEITLKRLDRMSVHRIMKRHPQTWGDMLDMDFVRYLTREIIMLNPMENCAIHGSPRDWDDLPHDKSLFHAPTGCGLPIGNLTSQLFSNVYLGEFDDFMKRTLKCRHYGRYVDDFYVVSPDNAWLRSLAMPVKCFLEKEMGLDIQSGKTVICPTRMGVEYLGAYLKPWRTYVSRTTLNRMSKKWKTWHEETNPRLLAARIVSNRGFLCQRSGAHLSLADFKCPKS